ncbi:hypothetical protein, partial [Virgisporangium aurantiacum]|uniref:hypothetical protein n=1 Tax=Virgisporangium aurantiacum TaxID=175570 RepID=UPI00194F6FB0
MSNGDPRLDPPAMDGTHAHAFASHGTRVSALARHYAASKPLRMSDKRVAGEHDAIQLIAHLQGVSEDPEFRANPDEQPSRLLIPATLRQLRAGEVGTGKDYDMALIGLMVVVYRYRNLLTQDDVDFILRELVPPDLFGGHSRETEVLEVTFLQFDIPETENHLLMIESSRYLVNQLLFNTTTSEKHDNVKNGLTGWLLGYLHRVTKHDFLEFNSRPYQRLALHALLNLHEFARDESIRTAAQILLDYTMVKFAVSSNRQRRVGPFRRHQWKINHPDNEFNDLMAPRGDQVAKFFLAYTGPTDRDGRPTAFYPAAIVDSALIAGLAAYRPPPAAYIIAMDRDRPAALHRFYHGTRPQLLASADVVDGGVEIYYSSPSFLLTAGGMFLNSGYGHDDLDVGKNAWEETCRAQATTLLPTRSDVTFAGLIRFDPYPDPFDDPMREDPPETFKGEAVNTGVHKGFACGANLRTSDKSVFRDSSDRAPALVSHADRLFLAWRGSSNEHLNVAKVVLFSDTGGPAGIQGIERLDSKVVLG